jgi:hypothetical protein
MPNRYQRRLHRIEQAAHLQEFGGARMLRRARAERKLIVIQSSHRGPRRFSGGIGVFPDKTDGASILFPCGARKVPLCFHAVVRSRTRSNLAAVGHLADPEHADVVQGITRRQPAAARVGEGSWRAYGDAHDGQRPKQVHAVLFGLAFDGTAGFIRGRAVTWAVLAPICIADLVRKASTRAHASDRFPWDAEWPCFDRRADARAVASASSVADLVRGASTGAHARDGSARDARRGNGAAVAERPGCSCVGRACGSSAAG